MYSNRGMGWVKKWCHAEKNVTNLTFHVLGNNKSELINSILIFRLQTFNSEDGSMEWKRCMGGQTMTRSLFFCCESSLWTWWRLQNVVGQIPEIRIKSLSSSMYLEHCVFRKSSSHIPTPNSHLIQVISSQVQMNVPQCGGQCCLCSM